LERRARTARLAALAAGAASLALLFLADDYAAHGWSARYFASDSRGRFLVHSSTEHRTDFPNAIRPLARYVQYWDYDRYGVPASLPPLDVLLSADLHVPEGPPRSLRLRTPNSAVLSADGRPVEEAALVPGRHSVTVQWSGDMSTRANLRFQWITPDGEWEELPSRALRPADGAWPALRLWIWAIGLPACVLTALLIHAAARREGARRVRLLGLLAAGWIFGLGAGLRLYDYDVMPDFRENLDELSATWNGWQLLTDGTTRGWSLLHSLYGERVRRDRIAYYDPGKLRVMVPFLDHPPLFHLLAGAAAKLGGAAHWSHARLRHTRLVPIALSLLAIGITLAIGLRLDPVGPAPYFAGLLLGTVPTIAIQARAVKEDALCVPMLLMGLLCFLRWRDGGERRPDLVAAALWTGLAALAKVLAVVFVGALALLVLQRGRRREAALVLGLGLLCASLFFVYGALVDWNAFLEAQGLQSAARGVSWTVFSRFVASSLINQNWIGQGFLVFLWLAYAFSFAGRGTDPDPFLTLPVIVYTAAIGISAGTWINGWYNYPVLPLLCLGAGRFLSDLWARPGLLRGGLFVLLGLFYGIEFGWDREWAQQPANFAAARTQVAALTAALFAPYALCEVSRSAWAVRLARLATTLALAAFVALSGLFVARYDVLYDKLPNYDRAEYFSR
jgi:4-amino-4-deoxy-L-arabinose transferase-like glycosyltransferase